MNIERAKRIYETWRRVARYSGAFLNRYGSYDAILYDDRLDDFPPDIGDNLPLEREKITFTLNDDGYITCEDQVLSNRKYWR